VVAELAAARDERLEQPPADAASAPAALDVDREVRDVVVGGARVERVQAAPADDSAVRFADEDRMAGPARREPAPALRGGARLGLEGGEAVLDALVVDDGDRVRVRRLGASDGDG
jgi:hypothetical protein